jgi:hypothetical protein
MEAPVCVRMFLPPLVAEPVAMVVMVFPDLIADFLPALLALRSPLLAILDPLGTVIGQAAISDRGARGKLAGTTSVSRSIVKKVRHRRTGDP